VKTSATTNLETSRNAPLASVLGKPLFLLCTILALALFASLVLVLGLGTLGFFGQTTLVAPVHLPHLVGTTVITSVFALAFTIPIGLLAALYLTEFAGSSAPGWLDESLRFLAHVPPIVYGYFSVATFLPALNNLVPILRDYPALEAGIALAGMLVPGFLAQSRSALTAVPQHLRDGAFALGASKFATAWFVVIPAAKARLLGALLQSTSRAFGETMIVLLVFRAYASRQTANPETLTTFVIPNQTTVLSEFGGLRAMFSVACVLLVLTLLLDAARQHFERPSRGESR
jgi:phosphate transport system permease protein